jgi:putative endonuclease
MPFVYILRCSDQTLYVGYTDDLAVRERVHNEGFGARYTAARRPVRLVYSEWHDSIDSTLARERQLKHWSAKKKEALIDGDLSALKLLSRRRGT